MWCSGIIYSCIQQSGPTTATYQEAMVDEFTLDIFAQFGTTLQKLDGHKPVSLAVVCKLHKPKRATVERLELCSDE